MKLWANSGDSHYNEPPGLYDALPDDLRALIFGEAGEVRNVERNGRPEADGTVQSRYEEFQEISKVRELRWGRKHGPKSARAFISPPQQQQTNREQHRRADSLQDANVLNPLQDHDEVNRPKQHEADRRPVGSVLP